MASSASLATVEQHLQRALTDAVNLRKFNRRELLDVSKKLVLAKETLGTIRDGVVQATECWRGFGEQLFLYFKFAITQCQGFFVEKVETLQFELVESDKTVEEQREKLRSFSTSLTCKCELVRHLRTQFIELKSYTACALQESARAITAQGDRVVSACREKDFELLQRTSEITGLGLELKRATVGEKALRTQHNAVLTDNKSLHEKIAALSEQLSLSQEHVKKLSKRVVSLEDESRSATKKAAQMEDHLKMMKRNNNPVPPQNENSKPSQANTLAPTTHRAYFPKRINLSPASVPSVFKSDEWWKSFSLEVDSKEPALKQQKTENE